MRLASKIILLLVTAVVAVTSLSSYFTSRQFIDMMEQQHHEIADTLAALSTDRQFHISLSENDSEYLFRKLQDAMDRHTRVEWSWMTEETTVFSNGEIRTRKTIQRTHPDGHTLLATYFPMESGSRPGYFEITSPLNPAYEQARQTWQNGIWSIAALGLVAVGVVVVGGIRMIARPLEQLTDKIKRIGKGDFSEDLEISTRDEFGQLGEALNQMCAHLKTQQQMILDEKEKRIEALEQLRHADRLKTVGQLAAGFAHEVGTPLNVISARADMLQQESLDSDEIEQHAREIKSESNRISDIVRKLLEFARHGNSQKVDQDLREVIERCRSLLDPILSNRDLKLEIDLPNSPAMAEYDFSQIQQVILNLIDNAMDASPTSSIVRVQLERDGEQWALRIIDSGRGIAESDLEQVFEPFFTTKEVGQGTGLGLSIVHGIVSDHEGTIEIDSTLGQGTTVIIRLPASDAHEKA